MTCLCSLLRTLQKTCIRQCPYTAGNLIYDAQVFHIHDGLAVSQCSKGLLLSALVPPCRKHFHPLPTSHPSGVCPLKESCNASFNVNRNQYKAKRLGMWVRFQGSYCMANGFDIDFLLPHALQIQPHPISSAEELQQRIMMQPKNGTLSDFR